MQINKRNRGRSSQKSDGRREAQSAKRAEAARNSSRPQINKPVGSEKAGNKKTEDVLIDLYDDSIGKSKRDDELIINIDFSRPIEIFGRIYRQIIKWLRVAQSKTNWQDLKKLRPKDIKENKKTAVIVAASFVGVMLIASLMFKSFLSPGSGGLVQGEADAETITLNAEPEFALLYPDNRTREELSIALVSPPGAAPVFTYVDLLDEINIQVSQQRIPDDLKSNQEAKLKELAEGFTANTPINGDDYRAFLGTSDKGPQSVIAIKGELLILIKSSREIKTDFWRAYLSSLQP